MAWTVPRTWETSEVVTAALMNTHVRDNTQYLKDVLDGVQGNQTVTLRYAAADTNGQTVNLTKARGSIASPSAITSGDNLGDVWFYGYYNSGYRAAALIRGYNDVAPSGSAVPGALQFYTNPDGTGPYERLRIASTGQTRLGVDGTVSLPALSWTGDTDTGIWRSAANTIDISTNGVSVAQFTEGAGFGKVSTDYSFGWIGLNSLIAGGASEIIIAPAGNTVVRVTDGSTEFGQNADWLLAQCIGASAAGLVPMVVNRDTNDGTLISLQQSSTEEGTISVSGTTVSYNGFMGAHYVQLKPEQAQPPRYAVVAADDHLIPSENPNGPARENEPYIRPAKAADTAVYGVWGGKIKDDATGSSFGIDGQPVYQIASLGLYRCLACDDGGPIAVGDLLEAADTRWHARRQADDIVRSSTLGKALEALPSGKGSVACVLYAG